MKSQNQHINEFFADYQTVAELLKICVNNFNKK